MCKPHVTHMWATYKGTKLIQTKAWPCNTHTRQGRAGPCYGTVSTHTPTPLPHTQVALIPLHTAGGCLFALGAIFSLDP